MWLRPGYTLNVSIHFLSISHRLAIKQDWSALMSRIEALEEEHKDEKGSSTGAGIAGRRGIYCSALLYY